MISSLFLVARVSIVAQSRRRLTSLLLIALPWLLFLSMRTSGRSLGLAALGVGTAWSLAAMSAFGMHENRAMDARLTRSGLASTPIFAGRLLGFVTTSLILALVLAGLVPLIDDAITFTPLLIGLLLAAASSVSVGMVIGLVMPDELESVLIIIGVFGIPLGLSLDSTALKFAPGYGSILYLQYLGDRSDPIYFIQTAVVSLSALVIAWLVWLYKSKPRSA